MTKETSLQAAMKKGVRMINADIAYAKPEQKQEHERLNSLSAMSAFQDAVDQAQNEKHSASELIFKGMQGAQAIWQPRTELRKVLRRTLVNWLLSDQLCAIGFEHPRKMDNSPKQIPPEYWHGTPNWDNNVLSYQSVRIVDIVVVHPQWLSDVEQTPSTMKSNKVSNTVAKVGRPCVSDPLKRSFDALVQANEIDPTQSFASHFNAIRAWLQRHHPNMKPSPQKLSDNVIRKHLSNSFNVLRK